MQLCNYTCEQVFNCVQWLGDNIEEIDSALGGRVGASPFRGDQLTLRGGDSYIVIYLKEWILWDNNQDFHVVDDETFKKHYKLMETENAN